MHRLIFVFVFLFALILKISCDNSLAFRNEDEATKAGIDVAIATILAIHHACHYREQNSGKSPESTEELIQREDLVLDEKTGLQWNFSFQFTFDKVSKIVAESTDKMPGGLGYEIIYDRKAGKFKFIKP
jgi:hypothetical protein